jgi:MFS family permease
MAPYLQFLRRNAPWLGAGFLLALLSTFGQTAFVAVFAGELMERHGLSEGGWGLIYAAGTTLSAATMIWAGALADRVALPRLAAWVLAGLAVTCAAMAAAPGAWALVPLVLGLRLFGQGMLSHIALVAMARWFVATRGRAIAFAALGFSAGQAVLPLLFTALLPRVGAGALWLLCGAICLAAILPARRLLSLPRQAEARATEIGADGRDATAGLSGRHWTRAEVLRSGLFWALVPALLASPSFGTAFFFFQTHLPEAKGWSQIGFVALFPLIMAAATASTFLSGPLIDRHGARRLFAPSLLPMGAAFAVLAWAPSLAWAVPGVLLLAVTQGTMATVSVALWAELYGTRHIGSIKAAAAAVMVAGTALGPGLVGAGIDAGMDFPEQMPWIALSFAAAAAAAYLALRRGAGRLAVA